MACHALQGTVVQIHVEQLDVQCCLLLPVSLTVIAVLTGGLWVQLVLRLKLLTYAKVGSLDCHKIEHSAVRVYIIIL